VPAGDVNADSLERLYNLAEFAVGRFYIELDKALMTVILPYPRRRFAYRSLERLRGTFRSCLQVAFLDAYCRRYQTRAVKPFRVFKKRIVAPEADIVKYFFDGASDLDIAFFIRTSNSRTKFLSLEVISINDRDWPYRRVINF
jgi:hypothetical protein